MGICACRLPARTRGRVVTAVAIRRIPRRRKLPAHCGRAAGDVGDHRFLGRWWRHRARSLRLACLAPFITITRHQSGLASQRRIQCGRKGTSGAARKGSPLQASGPILSAVTSTAFAFPITTHTATLLSATAAACSAHDAGCTDLQRPLCMPSEEGRLEDHASRSARPRLHADASPRTRLRVWRAHQ